MMASSTIDLSQLPSPDAIENLDAEALQAQFMARFLSEMEALRIKDPTLPEYDAQSLEVDPIVAGAVAYSYTRTLDRGRVNDAMKAVLAPLAKGSSLDHVVAGRGVTRLLIRAADPVNNVEALYESDARLLERYMLSFGIPSAGTEIRYLYEAYTAWPLLSHAKVNGFEIHGRRGDTDIVISGPGGRTATTEEKALVRNAILLPHVKPEAVNVAVINATRREYSADLTLEVPSGPQTSIIEQEAIAAIRAACDTRTKIAGEIPFGFIPGLAYVANVLTVVDNNPVVIPSDPYTVPVLTSISINVVVRQ